MEHKKYGLLTAIAMIVGIVIGSGIFFKSDNILIYTDGNIFLGVVVFTLSATAIIFGSLSMGELAARTDRPGGIVAYAEEFCSDRMACGMGWFQAFIYYPTIIAVIGWVSAIYTFMLFGHSGTLEQEILLGSVYIVVFYLLNSLSAKLGSYFQNASTLIKLIPLLAIGIAGLIFGDPQVFTSSVSTQAFSGSVWFAAVGPIAFAFDGWIVSTSIGSEIKNSRRNLPMALIVAPVFTLLFYVVYFVGIGALIGPQQIMEMGDAHVYAAAAMVFGDLGSTLLVTFITVSVLGTLNGLIIGSIRMPYSLALRGYVPATEKLAATNEKLDIPLVSAAFSMLVSLFWTLVHYLSVKYNMLPNSDISEISITFSYLAYLILYYHVYKMARRGEIKSVWRGYVTPILAACGSLFILYGGMQNPLFPIYGIICAVIVGVSQLYYLRNCANKL